MMSDKGRKLIFFHKADFFISAVSLPDLFDDLELQSLLYMPSVLIGIGL